jgi:hypothetical protein
MSEIIQKNKKAVCSLSLILMLAMTLMLAFAQPALAQVGMTQPRVTAGYISVAPLLVGVGQKATVNLWVFPTPEDYAQLAAFQGFSGITVTFTKPDGTKDTFAPVDGTGAFAAGQTEAIGDIFFFYAPDEAGNWSVSFVMPAQNITDNTGTVQYAACTSDTAYFTVQTNPVNAGLLDGYPWSQLPNSNVYWSYPINSNNREWSAISGDWLLNGVQKFSVVSGVTSNAWQPYGLGPNTAHIVWDQQLGAGGLVGGEYGSISSELQSTGGIGGGFGLGAVVMAGKAFTNIPNTNEFECIDLATGKVLYTMPGQISCGIHEPGNAYSQNIANNGVVLGSSLGAAPSSYLFGSTGTTWNFYDPYTGTIEISISNVTAGSFLSYQLVDGTPLVYGITADLSHLFAWNMSRVVNNNWPTGITWTRPLWLPIAVNNGIIPIMPVILGLSADQSTIVLTGTMDGTNQYYGFSTKDGTSLWNVTLPYTVGVAFSLFGPNDFVVYDPVDATFHCYSMLTGTSLWTSPSFASSPWATEYAVYSSETNDNNNLYIMFPDGTIRALSLATGQLVWQSASIPSTEYINNVVPYYQGMVMAGGNIYAYAGYSPGYEIDPIPRFAMLVCVNATTGDITWTLNGGVNPKAAADGYIIGLGQYDGNLYCIGKGQTSTSVTAQQQVGGSVLIQGSVLDQSAAQPNTPAISDANMSVWMDYLHMQNSTLLNNPPQCIGVPVTLTAVSSSTGTTINLGTTTSNDKGIYGFQWTPTTPGLYTIYATFAGSNSYYSSSAATYATVSIAPTASPTPTPVSISGLATTSSILTYIIIAVIVMVIAIAIATVLLLRRHP